MTPRAARRALWRALVVAAPALVALRIATYSGVVGIDVVGQTLRIVAVAGALFAVVGFGLVRLGLPDALRRHELLWVLPTGAVATAFAMTPLGFLGLPFALDLGLVIAGGLALSAFAVRHRGLPHIAQWRPIAWPAYLGMLLFCVALVPLFRAGFLTVIGDGSDAHLAAGTAEFLKHAPPRGVDVSAPVDQMPLVWRSKQAIYYAFAAVSALSGLATWQVLSVLCVGLLTLAAVGWFVFAREVLGATYGAAAIAMLLAGTIRMVVHTGIHPYFNQTWGYLTVPFALTLSWWVVRAPSRGGLGLLALFLAVCALAYPLAVPIPALVLLVAWWVARRRRRAAGERVVGVRDAWRRFHGLRRRWRYPGYVVALLMVVPAFGVWEKITGAGRLMTSAHYSLAAWGGDLLTWFPEPQFFAIGIDTGWWIALLVITGFAARELWRLDGPMRWGLVAILVVGALVAVEMRVRDYGWYFHFKMLAFVGPLLVVLGAVGAVRARQAAGRVMKVLLTLGLAVWIGWAANGARDEVASTYDELPRTTQQLRRWSASLPPGSSVRLDVQPAIQLWAAYMLSDQRLCSQRPLSDTSYPHVVLSRKADYVLVRYLRKPVDAIGSPVLSNAEYQLYRMAPGTPGRDTCSQRMIQTVQRIQRG